MPIPSDEQPKERADSGYAPQLFASKETRERLGVLAGRIVEFAGGKDVTFISAADIEARLPKRSGAGSVPEALNFLDLHDAGVKFKTELLEKNPQMKEAHILHISSYGASSDLARDALMGKAEAGVIKKNEYLPAGHCVVTLPLEPQSVRDIPSFLSGVPVKFLKNIPGNGKDWESLVILHELGHCNDPYSRPGKPTDQQALRGEVYADRYALKELFNDKTRDTTYVRLLPEALEGMRTLGAFIKHDDIHATGPALDHEEHSHDHGVPDIDADFRPVYNKVMDEVAKVTGIDREEAIIISKHQPELLYETAKVMNHRGDFRDNPVQQKYVDQFLQAAETYAPDYFRLQSPDKPAVQASGQPDKPVIPTIVPGFPN